MKILSKTGLLASKVQPVQRYVQDNTIELQTLVKSAPLVLKPLAGLYNPYPAACSILCNHPTPALPVPVVKQHRSGFQPLIYTEKYLQEPTKTGLNELSDSQRQNAEYSVQNQTGSVPEELFGKYTETDSRPLTPTPTVTSATTTGVNRRCLTPQPVQKPKLIVDLRRTHSQETLSWTVYSEQGPSVLSGESAKSSPVSSPRSVITNTNICTKKQLTPSTQRSSRSLTPRSLSKQSIKRPSKGDEAKELTVPLKSEVLEAPKTEPIIDGGRKPKSDEEEMPRRRGKRKKARSRVGTAVKAADKDPETQVASIHIDLNSSDEEGVSEKCDSNRGEIAIEVPNNPQRFSVDVCDSFLEPSVIKILQRELTQEVIDAEFDDKRKIALEEALRCSYGKSCINIKIGDFNELKADKDLWLSLPRNYSVKNAQFELPIDIEEFQNLTPLGYLEKYVNVTEKRRSLISFVFNRYKENSPEITDRIILGKNLNSGLGEVMGRSLNQQQLEYLQYLLNWKNEDQFNFRTFSSICVLCERLFAHAYWPSNPIDKTGNEVERVDFETLPRRLSTLDVHPQLKELLFQIRKGHYYQNRDYINYNDKEKYKCC